MLACHSHERRGKLLRLKHKSCISKKEVCIWALPEQLKKGCFINKTWVYPASQVQDICSFTYIPQQLTPDTLRSSSSQAQWVHMDDLPPIWESMNHFKVKREFTIYLIFFCKWFLIICFQMYFTFAKFYYDTKSLWVFGAFNANCFNPAFVFSVNMVHGKFCEAFSLLPLRLMRPYL